MASVYDYFIVDALKELAKIPLELQLKECIGMKILVLDYCGITSTHLGKFADCDVFVVENAQQNVDFLCEQYDLVYAVAYELQHVYVSRPHLIIVVARGKIKFVVLGNGIREVFSS